MLLSRGMGLEKETGEMGQVPALLLEDHGLPSLCSWGGEVDTDPNTHSTGLLFTSM